MAKLLLIYPPVADAYAVHGAAPELIAACREAGHEVRFLDLNLIIHDRLLNEQSVKLVYDRVQSIIREIEEEGRVLGPAAADRYRSLHLHLFSLTAALPAITSTRSQLRDSTVWRYDAQGTPILGASHIWELARREVFFSPYGEGVDRDGREADFFMSTTRIERALASGIETLMGRTIASLLSKELTGFSPDVVGFSVCFSDQVIPTLFAASVCKDILPQAVIVTGGSVPSVNSEAWVKALQRFHQLDALCVGDGEPFLVALLDRIDLSNNHLWDFAQEIPNLVARRPDRGIVIGPTEDVDYSTSPEPDYSMIPLGKYFTPLPQIMYHTARSCYWGKCSFCNYHHQVGRELYRKRSVMTVARHIHHLMSATGCHIFYLTDDAIPYDRLLALAEAFEKLGLPGKGMRWWALSRFDGAWDNQGIEYLVSCGLSRLVFGGESASPRLQRLLRKGFHPDRILDVGRRLSEHGLHSSLSLIVGVPTETPEERTATFRLGKEYSMLPHATVLVHQFRLPVASPLAETICKPVICGDTDLSLNYPYYEVKDLKCTHRMTLEGVQSMQETVSRELSNFNAELRMQWSNTPMPGFTQGFMPLLLLAGNPTKDSAELRGHKWADTVVLQPIIYPVFWESPPIAQHRSSILFENISMEGFEIQENDLELLEQQFRDGKIIRSEDSLKLSAKYPMLKRSYWFSSSQ